MLKINLPQIYGFFFIIMMFSCRGETRVDVSHIDVDIQIERFDRALDSLRPENVLEKNREWLHRYGYFYADYMQYMLEAGNPLDSARLRPILTQVIETEDF